MTMGAKGQKHGSAKSRSLEREGWVTVGGNQLTEAITLTVVVLTDAMGRIAGGRPCRKNS